MPLTAKQIEAAKPKEKPYKLADGGGLFLLINSNGSKWWRLKYRLDGKEKLLSLGVYPEVSLADVRERREAARKLIANDVDPSQARQEAKQAKLLELAKVANTFEAVAREWHRHKSGRWSEGYAADTLESFERDIFPFTAGLPINELKPVRWLEVFRVIEQRGALEKMRKVRQRCAEVYRYAIATGRAEFNAVADLGSALQTPQSQHYPFLRVGELPEFLRGLNGYSGSLLTKHGATLLMLTGVRTIELRGAHWSELNLDDAVWEIPAERMKMRRPHLVPLSRQAVALLRELQSLTGRYLLVFPGRNDPRQPMSEAAINQVIKRLGYAGRLTGHGFRHTMSTILHEQGFESAWIETQLAHVDKNQIRGTYNHAQYLEGRRRMLQWYADLLDGLAVSGNVVAARFGGAA